MSETTQYVMSKKSDLTSIADAVRSLINSTDSMSLDSIKSSVNTAKTNIDDAFSALQDKGVTVPSNGSVSDIASLIEAMQTGGDEFYVTSGSIVYVSEIDIYDTPVVIEHGLPKAPCVFFAVHGGTGCYPPKSLAYAYYATSAFGRLRSKNNGIMYAHDAGSSVIYLRSGYNYITADATNVTIAGADDYSSVKVGYSNTYGYTMSITWIALARK